MLLEELRNARYEGNLEKIYEILITTLSSTHPDPVIVDCVGDLRNVEPNIALLYLNLYKEATEEEKLFLVENFFPRLGAAEMTEDKARTIGVTATDSVFGLIKVQAEIDSTFLNHRLLNSPFALYTNRFNKLHKRIIDESKFHVVRHIIGAHFDMIIKRRLLYRADYTVAIIEKAQRHFIGLGFQILDIVCKES